MTTKATPLARNSQFLDLARKCADLAAQASQDALHSWMSKRIFGLAPSDSRTTRNVATMNFDGTLTDRQLLGNLAACQALPNQAIDLSLPRRQISHCPPPRYHYVHKTAKVEVLFHKSNGNVPGQRRQLPRHHAAARIGCG